MLSLDEVVSRLADRKLKIVAQETGLHYNTVLRVAGGKKSPENVTYDVVKRLSDYLTGEQ